MTRIYSYVVRYDSGFAPNPFYGYCTLATCKPAIRQAASVGDWVVGSASNDKSVGLGGHMVYVMKISETMSFQDYFQDPRFESKKPYRRGSRKQSCGDNIYFYDESKQAWQQLDSFHSTHDGQINADHVQRDTGINRVLVSDDFVYFGGGGPKFPDHLVSSDGRNICKQGIGHYCFDDPQLVERLEEWIRGMGVSGYQAPPFEWMSLRG